MTLIEFENSYKARKFFGATNFEWRTFSLLVFRDQLNVENAISYLWPDPDGEPTQPKNLINIYVSAVRRKLKARNLEINIKTVWGAGYFMTKDDRAKAIELARKAMEQ